MTSSTAAYDVLTTSPPVLILSTSSPQIGQPLTIQGSNFAGLAAGTAVILTSISRDAPVSQATKTLPVNAVLDGNGNFSVTWTVNVSYSGSTTIVAQAEQEGSWPAVLGAQAQVTIQAAATATVTVNATASASAASGAGNTSTTSGGQGNSNGAALLIIFLITGIILTLLVIVGIVIFLTMHRRDTSRYGSSERGPASGYAAYGGYSDYGQAPYDGYSDYGQYDMPPPGRVSQWDEDPDPEPGPNWRPRPMSGYYPQFGSGQAAPPPNSDSGWGQSQQVPTDPWDDQHERIPDPANDQWPDLGGNSGGSGTNFWP
jgi:hypothetical protein